jgi:hypothetical protein
MNRRTTLLGAVLVCVPLLTGCGGTGQPPPTREQYALQANAICAEGNRAVRKLGPEPPILTAEQATWLLRLTKIDRSTVDRIRALERPTEDRVTLGAMLSSFQRGLGRGEAIARASRAGNDAVFRANVDAALDELTTAQRDADRLGLNECAQLGSVTR